MSTQNDRKGAIKRLKLLAFNSKTTPEIFRKNIDREFKTVFLPNNVECTEYKYGDINCDILVPEIYSSNRVTLYIHGGSFIGGSKLAWRSFCSSIANKTFSRVVVPEYRLAPTFPYPAAIEDIQSVFRALFTEEQISCSLNAEEGHSSLPEIIIAADGAGASIACAFLFNLRERFKKCIKKVIFLSPWLDISPTSSILSAKKKSDEIMSDEILRKSSLIYTYETNTSSPFISPLLATEEQLVDFPPLYIQMGEKEILLEDAKSFTEKMISIGNKCELDVWPNMCFMFQMAEDYLAESHLAVEKIGKVVTDNEIGQIEIQNRPKLEHSINSEA